MYRRPLPTANLSFLSAVMFDGRETKQPLTSAPTFAANLVADLSSQAVDATTTHAQAAAPPTDAQVSAIVNFELALFAGQYWDYAAGALDAGGASGGPVNLAVQPYYPGVNDSLGQDPQGHAFTPASMQLFAAWANLSPSSPDARRAARADIAAGEQLFDSSPMVISNVRGLNDNVALSSPTSFSGTCATCHDTPNIGHHSLPLPLDIGIGHLADPAFEPDPVVAAAVAELSEPDLPVFLISGCPNPFNPGQVASFYTTDPGKALVSGHCSDFNRAWQGSDPARARRPRAILSQRFRWQPSRGRQFLQPAIPDEPDRPAEAPARRIPQYLHERTWSRQCLRGGRCARLAGPRRPVRAGRSAQSSDTWTVE